MSDVSVSQAADIKVSASSSDSKLDVCVLEAGTLQVLMVDRRCGCRQMCVSRFCSELERLCVAARRKAAAPSGVRCCVR
ncbi:Hypothetical predicted protein [Scomber scombrus]|uniref:Uncharacterized protein n=1 Tax=Scomber scombrus TaxID=13677 RepID=A0AAV1Q967_SCOSC